MTFPVQIGRVNDFDCEMKNQLAIGLWTQEIEATPLPVKWKSFDDATRSHSLTQPYLMKHLANLLGFDG